MTTPPPPPAMEGGTSPPSTPTFEDHITTLTTPGPQRTLSGVTFYAANANEILYDRSFGTRSIADPTPMTADDIMWLASSTKLITSIAALQLIEAGKLDLDTDAANLLPELLNGIGVLKGFDEQGKEMLEPAKEKVTLRRLLSHQAGFSYAFIFPDTARAQVGRGVDPTRDCGKLPEWVNMPLAFEPGQGWAYGVNIEVVGLMIEKVTGMRLFDYMQKYIFDPLGIKDMCYSLEQRPDLKARYVPPVKKNEEGELADGIAPWPLDARDLLGGGGLFGCAREYFMILRAVFAEDERLLKSSTYQMMYHVECRDPLTPMPIASISNNLNKLAPVPAEKIVWGHGLASGIMVSDQPGWMREGTLHWGGMLNHYWNIDHRSGITTFMAVQYDPFEHPDVVHVKSLFHSEMLKRFGKQ